MNRTGQNVRDTSKGERAVNTFTKKVGILTAAIAFVGIGSISHADDLLYDWNAVNQATTPVSGYTPAPFVSDANAASVVTQLTAQQAATPGKVAVKILSPLSAGNTALLFNNPNFQINYAFLDFETPVPSGGNANVLAAQSQAQLIHAPGTKGAATFVGNYRLFPGNGDTSGTGAGPSFADYTSGGPTGVNMANEDLYPGSPFYKSPQQVTGGTSSAPNIRSSLFVLPIERLSFVTSNLPAGNAHIPYVNRFNNSGNAALDSDNNPANGYRFTNPTGQQMLSRSDFQALVAHYRLRGATGIHLLDGGVEGYTQAQFEQDAKDGFTFTASAGSNADQVSAFQRVSGILSGGGARIATLDTTSTIDNQPNVDNESKGVVFSGVYSLTQGTGKLALLVSNMDESSHSLLIQQSIGGKTVPNPITILGGTHKLLEFTGAGLQWSLANTTIVFDQFTDRSGVGVPEPVAMGGASIFALAMLFRRRRAR